MKHPTCTALPSEKEKKKKKCLESAFYFAPETISFYISSLILTIKHLATKVFPWHK